ncbi:hypothetical protein [Nocardia neocaledoniensis]|uniref:hypothetical protein n=1 Tax=Nocardia neocaledoniensis TaxID=236511 RepID=UPI002458D86C|nr:hypothetical protein [Nocardia neocaledoniensis]
MGTFTVEDVQETGKDTAIAVVRCTGGVLRRGDHIGPLSQGPTWDTTVVRIIKYGFEREFIDQTHRGELHFRGTETSAIKVGMHLYTWPIHPNGGPHESLS